MDEDSFDILGSPSLIVDSKKEIVRAATKHDTNGKKKKVPLYTYILMTCESSNFLPLGLHEECILEVFFKLGHNPSEGHVK